MSARSTRLAARLWWWLLPFAGGYGYAETGRWRWFMPYLAWRFVAKLPGSDPFEPYEPVVCNCDYCRGVPGAVFKP